MDKTSEIERVEPLA